MQFLHALCQALGVPLQSLRWRGRCCGRLLGFLALVLVAALPRWRQQRIDFLPDGVVLKCLTGFVPVHFRGEDVVEAVLARKHVHEQAARMAFNRVVSEAIQCVWNMSTHTKTNLRGDGEHTDVGKAKLDLPLPVVCRPGVEYSRSHKHDLAMAFPVRSDALRLVPKTTTVGLGLFLGDRAFNFRRASFQGLLPTTSL